MTGGSRIVLGTVQLGMAYGVANVSGRPDMGEALKIVETAWRGGVRVFDTAPGYGESEQVLGECFRRLSIGDEARVVTKLSVCEPDAVKQSLAESMRRLGVDRLHGVMLHRQDDLAAMDSELGRTVAGLKDDGLVGEFGVSVYDPDVALKALSMDGIDMVQIPANALDRRFERAGVFELAGKLGKTLYTRSVYLQGLLLMREEDVPVHLARAVPLVREFQALADEFGLTRIGLALGYVRNAAPDAMILIGVERAEQLAEGLASLEAVPGGLVAAVRSRFPEVEESIVNPSLWSAQ